MTGRPEFFIVESDINKEYFPSFAVIISTLITEKIPLGQLTPWANSSRGPTNPGLPCSLYSIISIF